MDQMLLMFQFSENNLQDFVAKIYLEQVSKLNESEADEYKTFMKKTHFNQRKS